MEQISRIIPFVIAPDILSYKNQKFQLLINNKLIKEDLFENLTNCFGEKGSTIKSQDGIIIFKWNSLSKKWINHTY